MSENTFQSFNMEVYKNFFSWIFSFSSGQVKLLVIISISKEIRPTLRLSYISVYIKRIFNFLSD